MNAVLIALIFSAGASVWIYTKLQRQAGYGNSKNALIGVTIAFALIFVVVFTLAHTVLPKN